MSAFTPAGSGGVPTQIEMTGAQNPLISNILLASADTEVGIALPAGCRKFLLKLRDTKLLQLAFVANESNTNYITIRPGCVYSESDLDATKTIYVQSPVASQIVELVTWT